MGEEDLGDHTVKPVAADYSDLLTPLLSDEKSKASEHRLRKRAYNEQRVHPADVEEWIEKGWGLHREGKRVSTLRKDKPHDQLLEDRVWCFLHNMGYAHLNGGRFNIEFERDDGSRGRKQIDVFACDDETAFIIECKSKETLGPRPLTKDIHETISLKEYIRKSIFTLYNEKPKPKILWLYATYNIRWSEPDVARATDGGVSIITENEIQYYEAFLKYIGKAGKCQVLGEFLPNQKVPGLGVVKVPAVRGRIGGETFYSFVATPRRLLKIAFINHQALNHPDGTPAYQRMLSAKRIKDIGGFITQGGYFPTNVLVNFMDRPKFELLPNKENTDPNIKFGWLTLPSKYRSAWVIDGQHRLYGYSRTSEKHLDQSLFVLAFEKMATHKEADLFININHKQKSVPKGLLDSLLAEIRLGDPDPKTNLSALSSAVIKAINSDKSGPLFRRFQKPDVPAEPGQSLTISEAIRGLNKSGLLGKAIKKNKVPGVLSGPTDTETIGRSMKVLNGYFAAIRDANPEKWEAGKLAFICVNPGIRAHLALIAETVKYLSHKKGVEFAAISPDEFISNIVEVIGPICEFVQNGSGEEIKEKFSRRFGEAGVKDYLFCLYELIYDQNKDFGSEEFHTYITQKDSDRVKEADQFVLTFTQDLSDFVIETLKRKYGTHRLESGEHAYWELGIESAKIKKNAANRQIDDDQGRRLKKEAYLDILDLKIIIEQKGNWDTFKNVLNAPAPDERKGKTYYTGWIAKFNELRRIPAHKSSLRIYKEADFEFLDWLHTNVNPRLQAARAR